MLLAFFRWVTVFFFEGLVGGQGSPGEGDGRDVIITGRALLRCGVQPRRCGTEKGVWERTPREEGMGGHEGEGEEMVHILCPFFWGVCKQPHGAALHTHTNVARPSSSPSQHPPRGCAVLLV
eukprot:TRINITY_DN6102_c1_g5_i1.p7 TRINITY_DN6102_c1_g5~~TRINITY_DN6102_c1_g5_i1.p7  ORF type:complete len:122 (-),score=0.89 TRINITY_DN6102_c1_g5_i1:2181-2546(-)